MRIGAGAGAAVHRRVGDEDGLEGAGLVAQGEGGVAVGFAALAFGALARSAVLEGVHRVARDAAEGRGDVAHGVVNARPARGAREARAEGLGVVREERIDGAEEAVGAERGAEER